MAPSVTTTSFPGDPGRAAPPDPPQAGQCLLDPEGLQWKVQEVIISPSMKGFYIVRIAKGPSPHAEQDVVVLGRGEYTALCKEHKLRMAF
jgi:hypothetical protein